MLQTQRFRRLRLSHRYNCKLQVILVLSDRSHGYGDNGVLSAAVQFHLGRRKK